MESGVFLIDKPAGPTSFRLVQQVRRALLIKKVGHSGTLDPFASGLLVICAGRPATRIIPRLMDGDKEYEATLQLGIETETLDPEGKIIAQRPVAHFEKQQVVECLTEFVGEQLQTPPFFSALKHKGKPLYYYARQGRPVTKAPRCINIKAIEYIGLDYEQNQLTIKITCGKGTYIRTLAADIGTALGCGAHLRALRRLRNGPFSVVESLSGAMLSQPEEGRRLLLEHHLSVEEVRDMLDTRLTALPLLTKIVSLPCKNGKGGHE